MAIIFKVLSGSYMWMWFALKKNKKLMFAVAMIFKVLNGSYMWMCFALKKKKKEEVNLCNGSDI